MEEACHTARGGGNEVLLLSLATNPQQSLHSSFLNLGLSVLFLLKAEKNIQKMEGELKPPMLKMASLMVKRHVEELVPETNLEGFKRVLHAPSCA